MARQYGLAFLPFLLMEHGKLIERQATALGVHDLNVEWTVLSGAAPMNDGLLSGELAFGSGTPPALILRWDKTRTQSNQVRGVSAIATMPPPSIPATRGSTPSPIHRRRPDRYPVREALGRGPGVGNGSG